MLLAPPPTPVPLALVAPAEREASFGRIAGRLPRGRWAVVVRVGGRTLAVRKVGGSSFDFWVSLPRRDVTLRVTAYGAARRRATAKVEHVYGLPRSARPRAVSGSPDGDLELVVRRLARSFPGTSAVYVEDIVTGRGAAWNARARFPAASTLKVAIAVEALRIHAGKPEPGSYLDVLIRRMLIDSDNDAANDVEALFGGGSSLDELLRGIGLRDTWMGGGYLRETAGRTPIPVRVDSQPSFGCCKYTTAFDLARHDAGLVYWPGGVFVAAVMTWGSRVGISSDVLAGRVAHATLRRLQQTG